MKTKTRKTKGKVNNKKRVRFLRLDYYRQLVTGKSSDIEGIKSYVCTDNAIHVIYESGLIISAAAKKIKEMTSEKVHANIAPPDLWNRRQDTGKSAAEIFAENGVPLVAALNDRVQGWYNLKEWLKPGKDEFGKQTAPLRIMSNCTNLIRTLPAVTVDGKNPNDVAREPHELTHAPDAIRYFVACRPSPAAQVKNVDEDVLEYDDQINNLLYYE
jgi:phage terminase large subunit